MKKEFYIKGKNSASILKAISSDVRLQILDLLSEQSLNINSICEKLNLSKTTVLSHINILEKTGFIKTKYIRGSVGNQRICSKVYDSLTFDFSNTDESHFKKTHYETEIPIGNYFDFDAWSPCGLASQSSIIGKWDDPFTFCDVQRVDASIIWNSSGYLEYKIPLDAFFNYNKVSSISIECEITAYANLKDHENLKLPDDVCMDNISRTHSDITVWLNGTEIGTNIVACGNDLKEVVYTPTWWRTRPIYGFPFVVELNQSGCFINGKKTHSLNFDEIIGEQTFLYFKIGVKRTAKNQGGFAIMGKNFGKKGENIIVRSYID